MKIEIKEEKPVPPPKVVILTLTEEEAGLIYWVMKYYSTSTASIPAAVATRCRDKLKQFANAPNYPYTDAFQD